jgi:spermidine synthase
MESGQLVSSFSLVLVPPLTTKAGAFVSTAAGEVWSLDDEPRQMQQSVGGGFAQANNYVVCVTESASSWSAFQVISFEISGDLSIIV